MAGDVAQESETARLIPHRELSELVLDALGSDARTGLSADEARARLVRWGHNTLPAARHVPAWRKFLSQFADVLVILLIVAALISTALWLYERESALPYEAMAILAIVFLNALLGFGQQQGAERSMAALRRMTVLEADVVRDGARRTVPAANLVPGDIIIVEDGDRIPADARLIALTALRTAESALTGESLPVVKSLPPIADAAALGDRHNMIFSGTAVVFGRAQAVVTATGTNTEIGRIARLLHTTKAERTPMQRALDRVGRLLGLVVIMIAVVMIITIVLVEKVTELTGLLDVLILGVALAVAAVPEGLPAVVTAALSIGVRRMAKRNAIVRHLAAVETLGSANVIASDKTGTLTRNEMTVQVIVTAGGRVSLGGTGYAPVGDIATDAGTLDSPALRREITSALTAAARANNAALFEREGGWSIHGDPTEAALIVAARKAGLEAAALDARFTRIAELPFSSERKLMSVIDRDATRPDNPILFTKGAPDLLLARCSAELVDEVAKPLTNARRAAILTANEALAGAALRTLAVAFRALPPTIINQDTVSEGLEQELVFIGLIGMIDPPRAEARDAVARARAAGVRPIMITGDHPATASVIAAQLGIIGTAPLTGAEIEHMDDATLDRMVRDVSVYARVNPEHKLRIVESLQRTGLIVAMTGDGVNDAPALKKADIGVAMGITGTDVAKEAADIVLADDNFATIVAAIEEGRVVFANIRKFLRYLLSSNIGEVLTMFFGVLLGGMIALPAHDGVVVMPLLATQILWINLVTDGAPALALALGGEASNAVVMTEPPRTQGEAVITPSMWIDIGIVGIVMAIGTLAIFDASLKGGLIAGDGSMVHAQTMAFTTLIMFQLFNVFNVRSETASAFSGLFANRWLWGAVALSLLLQIAVLAVRPLQQAFSTTSLDVRDWLLCAAVASSVLWLVELKKLVMRRLAASPAYAR